MRVRLPAGRRTAPLDRGERPIRFLIGAAALLAAASAGAAARGEFAALVWTAPGHEREVLLEQPRTCLAASLDTTEVSVGRALFNAPGLLGGQAARAGISCASCHANGRRTAWFFLGGVSDRPGTADVSASFFSLARADARFDPRPIPDLAAPGKVSRDPANRALETFIRGLIVEEFAGREPSPAALGALAAYVRAIRACPGAPSEPRTLAAQVALTRQSAAAARTMAERGESAAASVLVGATRHQLGLIDERLPGVRFARERALLLAASRALQPIGEAARPDAARLGAWAAYFDRDVAPKMTRASHSSLYDPKALDRWLRQSPHRD